VSAPIGHGPMTAHRSPEGVETTCLCRQTFTAGSFTAARGLLDAHLADEARLRPGSVRVILAHTTAPGGLRETVAVGPLMSTAGVMAARLALEASGAECEVVSLASVAQWCRAHGWTDLRAEPGR
jgi:hypothetical protein